MTVTAKAAVTRAPHQPMQIEDINIENPREGEVLVRISGVGICHTDVVMRDQLLPIPQPVVLGHEGAGVVEAVGSGVTKVAPGDAVVLSFNSCGHCPSCAHDAPAYCHDFGLHNFAGARSDGSSPLSVRGEVLHGNIFGQSSFATRALAHERNVVKVPADLPLHLLGPLGCGIQTGAGAVLNAFRLPAGANFAVFGAGAVGLSAVMAARIAGAATIFAVDLQPERLALALELGATHAISAREDAAAAIRAVCPAGVDFVLDTTGIAKVIEDAVTLLAPRGVCGILGASALDATLTFNEVFLMAGGRTVRGIVEGDSNPEVFIPELLTHYRAGRFPFDRLVRVYDFTDINTAFAEAESGVAIKPVLRMPQ
jgi:aryl-alcohol dehydrogenase